MIVKVEPYKTEHGIEIMKTLFEPHENLEKEMEESAELNYSFSKEAYTLFVDDIPIVSGGIFIVHDGVGEAWMFFARKASEFPILVMSKIKKYIKEIMERNSLVRLQAAVLSNFKSGNRIAEVLGFINETPNGMKNYRKNRTSYNLYALTKEE